MREFEKIRVGESNGMEDTQNLTNEQLTCVKFIPTVPKKTSRSLVIKNFQKNSSNYAILGREVEKIRVWGKNCMKDAKLATSEWSVQIDCSLTAPKKLSRRLLIRFLVKFRPILTGN